MEKMNLQAKEKTRKKGINNQNNSASYSGYITPHHHYHQKL